MDEIKEKGWSGFISLYGQEIGVRLGIVKSKNLKEGDNIRVNTKPSPDGWKFFIDKLEKF